MFKLVEKNIILVSSEKYSRVVILKKKAQGSCFSKLEIYFCWVLARVSQTL